MQFSVSSGDRAGRRLRRPAADLQHESGVGDASGRRAEWVDVTTIKSGQQILVLWRSRPISLVQRSLDQVARVKADSYVGDLRDPNSDVYQHGAYAKNVYRSIKPVCLVLVDRI